MKFKIYALAVTLLALYGCADTDNATNPPTGSTEPFTVKVISFNDYHGNLESPGTLGTTTAVATADRPPVGGADFLAAHVAKLKAKNPLNVVVTAGDLIGASPLISGAFTDEPSVETLNRIGLEFSSVGNHEFDKGSAELLRLQNGGCKITAGATDPNSCKGAAVGTPVPFEGAKFKWLSANVVSTATSKPLLPAYGIKTFNGVKVAFIGMTLKGTPGIVTPSGVAGLSFNDEAETVNALVPELRAQGIESIIVLVHEGGVQSPGLGDINACAGDLAGSAIASIVSKLDDAVDVVISGHTHAAYNCKLSNAKGRKIAVTSANAFGRVLTDMDVTIDPKTKDITDAKASNFLVVRNDPSVPADATLGTIITGYKLLIAPVANVVLGSIATALPNARPDGTCNMPAGSLVADAQLAATKVPGFGDASIAFINGGGVRAGFTFPSSTANEGDGNVTYGEAFTVQPFGNSLVSMSLTSKDIKDFLEEQFAGCLGQGATNRIALPSAGFKYSWDNTKTCGSRIGTVTLQVSAGGPIETIVNADGTLPNASKTYRVTVNSFMADGGDGYSTLKKGTDRLGGAQDIDALSAFLAKYKAPLAAYDLTKVAEDAGTPRINRVDSSTTCPP
jgi:5'-nucleotidase